MYQGSQQNETVSSSSDALVLVPWLAAFCQFVHECRERQHDIVPHWQLCTHCDIRLAISCPRCTGPVAPVGTHACPCCGFAMPPVEAWVQGLQT
jgi:hypothetical protein